MKLKQTLIFAVVALILAAAAGTIALKFRHADFGEDAETIRNEMRTRSHAANQGLDEAQTQIDMNSASGGVLEAVEPFLAKSAEYRLRRLDTVAERVELLEQLIELTESMRRMFDESLEGAGSVEPMRRSLRAASMIQRQVDIWLLPDDKYREWTQLADAKLELDGLTIPLKNGTGTFKAERYDSEYELNVSLEPDLCFNHNGKSYAVVVEDMEGSLNSDFLRLHLCRLSEPGGILSKKVLRPVLELDVFYLSEINVKGNSLVLIGQKTHGQGDYREEIAIPE